MADTLRYSIQASVLVPSGFVGDYGRLQVAIRPQLNTITISAIDYDTIANALAEGRALNLADDTGRFLGQFATGLAGGFDIAAFTQAVKTDARISFKPSQELLASAREFMTFEQVPTVANDPQISDIAFNYDVAGVPTTIIDSISQPDSGLLRVVGTNFVKGKTGASVLQFDGTTGILTTAVLAAPINIGAKYLETLLTPTTLTALSTTALLPPGSYTRLKVYLMGTSTRNDFKNITII